MITANEQDLGSKCDDTDVAVVEKVVDSSEMPGSAKKKRRKKRRWKPYHKLTLEEKRELELRQQERAEKTRADRLDIYRKRKFVLTFFHLPMGDVIVS